MRAKRNAALLAVVAAAVLAGVAGSVKSAVAAGPTLVIWADRRFRLGHGRAFALYAATYCLGRLWVELLRTDPAEHFFGVRLNVFTAVIVGLGAVAYLIHMRGRPREVITRGAEAAAGHPEEAAAENGRFGDPYRIGTISRSSIAS